MEIKHTYIPWLVCCILAAILIVLQGILLYNSYDILMDHFSHGMALLVLSSLLIFSIFVFCSLFLLYLFYNKRSLDGLKKDFFKQVSFQLKEPFQKAYHASDLKTTLAELHRGNNILQVIMALSEEQEGLLEVNLSQFNVVEELELLKDRYLSETAIPLTIRITDRLESPLVEADKEHLLLCVGLAIEFVLRHSPESAYIQLITDKKKNVFSLSIFADGIKINKEKNSYYVETKEGEIKKINQPEMGLSYIQTITKKQKGWIEFANHFKQNDEFRICIPQPRKL